MAFVSSGFSRSSSIAFAVGSMSNWTWRRLASFFTSCMTGRAPVPVPMTSRLHFHGIFSSVETGVWPNACHFSVPLKAFNDLNGLNVLNGLNRRLKPSRRYRWPSRSKE
jgi:hypothetical protein